MSRSVRLTTCVVALQYTELSPLTPLARRLEPTTAK